MQLTCELGHGDDMITGNSSRKQLMAVRYQDFISMRRLGAPELDAGLYHIFSTVTLSLFIPLHLQGHMVTFFSVLLSIQLVITIFSLDCPKGLYSLCDMG